MSAWFAIPMVLSLATSVSGQQQAAAAQAAGAATSAEIEKMNREYQQRVFEKSIEKQKPFYEAGTAAIDPYAKAISGKGDAMTGGLAQMQKGMLEADTGSMSDYVKKLSMGRLEAEEGEKYKGRLLDLQQIGLGASGSAGQSSVNLGTALASSYQREGSTAIGASMNTQTALQNMWTQTMDTLSGLPAYYAASKGQSQFNVPSGWASQDTGTGLRTAWEK